MLAIIDKPKWYTSFDIIKKLKRLFPKIKIWHSWTLDPMATGVLLIGIDKDTKRLWKFQELDKEYIAEIDFTKDSDTWDLDFWSFLRQYHFDSNEVYINDKKIKIPDILEIKSKLDLLIPLYTLPLPDFSAKKVGGKKLYDLARTGKSLNMSRPMDIYKYEILDYTFPVLKIRFKVWSGTYIRSIAYWLGKQLNLWGILVSLRRESIWDYKLKS